jgi:hypothetical protein
MSVDRTNIQPCQSSSSVGSLRLSTHCHLIVRELPARLLQTRSLGNMIPHLMTDHPETRRKRRLALMWGPLAVGSLQPADKYGCVQDGNACFCTLG